MQPSYIISFKRQEKLRVVATAVETANRNGSSNSSNGSLNEDGAALLTIPMSISTLTTIRTKTTPTGRNNSTFLAVVVRLGALGRLLVASVLPAPHVRSALQFKFWSPRDFEYVATLNPKPHTGRKGMPAPSGVRIWLCGCL